MENFNLELLRNFLVVSRMQSFSKASAYLYVDQSTISKQIKQLEERFQIKLFVRTAQGVQLTAAGQQFAEHAQRLLDDFQSLGKASTVDWHQLRIGLFDNIAVSFCQQFLIQRFSDLALVKISNEGQELVSMFNQGELDLIMTNGLLKQSITGQFVSQKIADEEMMVLAGSQSHAVLHDSMQMKDLHGQKMLIAPEYCPVSQEIEHSASTFAELRQIDYTETMIQLVAHSDYLTILPAGMVKELVRSTSGLFSELMTDLPKRPVTAFAREQAVLDKVCDSL